VVCGGVCVCVGREGGERGGSDDGGDVGGEGGVCVWGGGEVVDSVLVEVVGDPTIFILPVDPSRTMYDKLAGYN